MDRKWSSVFFLLCCGYTKGCEKECCEKGLGSTYVVMRWKDPLNSGFFIESYYPHQGASQVYHIDKSGIKKDIRWCLDSIGPGLLE